MCKFSKFEHLYFSSNFNGLLIGHYKIAILFRTGVFKGTKLCNIAYLKKSM
jgi:hypothetical protein